MQTVDYPVEASVRLEPPHHTRVIGTRTDAGTARVICLLRRPTYHPLTLGGTLFPYRRTSTAQPKMTERESLLARILHEKEGMCSLFLQILHPLKPMKTAARDGITCLRPVTSHLHTNSPQTFAWDNTTHAPS